MTSKHEEERMGGCLQVSLGFEAQVKTKLKLLLLLRQETPDIIYMHYIFLPFLPCPSLM